MNYLAHLYLADRTGTSLAGSLLGDVVRGPLEGRYSPEIERGIRLHRRIDSFTDQHPRVLHAKARLRKPYRRYAGILLDVFFDHCLARDWPEHHAEPLEVFAQRVYRSLLGESLALASPAFVLRLTYMRSRDLLCSYRELDGVARAIEGLATRLSRPSPLPTAIGELRTHDAELRSDFRVFFPELVRFAGEAAS